MVRIVPGQYQSQSHMPTTLPAQHTEQQTTWARTRMPRPTSPKQDSDGYGAAGKGSKQQSPETWRRNPGSPGRPRDQATSTTSPKQNLQVEGATGGDPEWSAYRPSRPGDDRKPNYSETEGATGGGSPEWTPSSSRRPHATQGEVNRPTSPSTQLQHPGGLTSGGPHDNPGQPSRATSPSTQRKQFSGGAGVGPEMNPRSLPLEPRPSTLEGAVGGYPDPQPSPGASRSLPDVVKDSVGRKSQVSDKYVYCIPHPIPTLVHQGKGMSTQDKHHIS